MLKIGYHYTTWKNYKTIQDFGLTVHRVPEDSDLCTLIGRRVIYGTWLWPKEPTRKHHVMELITRAAQKNDTDFVLLEVEYEEEDMIKADGYAHVNITSYGNMELMKRKPVSCVFIVKDVPANKIKFLKRYNLLKLLK